MHPLLSLVVLLPVLAAALVFVFAARMGGRVASLSIALGVVNFVLTLAMLAVLWTDTSGIADHAFDPGQAWSALSQSSLLLDPLSALMAAVIAAISLIVRLYSRRYMAEEAGYARFFMLLDLMTAALLLMVMAGDLITLMIAWYLVGVLLYLLLGHDTRSHSAWRYGFWTFLTYRLGDLPLLIAAVLLYRAYDSWSLPEIFAAMAAEPLAHSVFGVALPEVVAMLVALSAFARSAQILLHNWLPWTMSGPTPVSALMHAGIVNAGGFLINRFAPVFIHSSDVLHVVFVVGLLTAIMGSVLMLSQHDIKKALGYSTMGQMGFMIMECGVGAFSLAIYHLIAHGVFKGTLFLSAGSVIHEARKDDGVPKQDLYTFVVERRTQSRQRAWLMMAAITLIVPALILFFAHYLVAADFFHQQGAVVLLFFGWMTGAQLLFITWNMGRMGAANPMRLFLLILASFTVVVLGYAVISHTFDEFLYPDAAMRAAIHAAAGINALWFDGLVALLALVIVLGWLFAWYATQQGLGEWRWMHVVRLRIYGVFSRELFVNEAFSQASRWLIGAANRVNVMLRWS